MKKVKKIKNKSKKSLKSPIDMGQGFLGNTQNGVNLEPTLKDYGQDAMNGLNEINKQISILKDNTRRLSIFANSLAIHLLDVNNTILAEFVSNKIKEA